MSSISEIKISHSQTIELTNPQEGDLNRRIEEIFMETLAPMKHELDQLEKTVERTIEETKDQIQATQWKIKKAKKQDLKIPWSELMLLAGIGINCYSSSYYLGGLLIFGGGIGFINAQLK